MSEFTDKIKSVIAEESTLKTSEQMELEKISQVQQERELLIQSMVRNFIDEAHQELEKAAKEGRFEQVGNKKVIRVKIRMLYDQAHIHSDRTYYTHERIVEEKGIFRKERTVYDSYKATDTFVQILKRIEASLQKDGISYNFYWKGGDTENCYGNNFQIGNEIIQFKARSMNPALGYDKGYGCDMPFTVGPHRVPIEIYVDLQMEI